MMRWLGCCLHPQANDAILPHNADQIALDDTAASTRRDSFDVTPPRGVTANLSSSEPGSGLQAPGVLTLARVGALDESRLATELGELAARLLLQPRLSLRFCDSQWAYSPTTQRLNVPRAYLQEYSLDGLKGALCREIGRWLYARGPLSPAQPSHAFCLLWHGVDQVRTNLWSIARCPDAAPFLQVFYSESLAALRRTETITSQAESFVQNIIAHALFGVTLERSSALNLAMQKVQPILPDLVKAPTHLDFVHSIEGGEATQAANRLFASVREVFWPLYAAFLDLDLHEVARSVPADANPPTPPQAEASWPWSAANPGPLAYDPTGHRTHQIAQLLLRDALCRWATEMDRQPAPNSDDENLQDPLVTWEQAMRRKALQAPTPGADVDFAAHLKALRDTTAQAQHAATQALDTSAYAAVCRRQRPTIEALKTAIGVLTAHTSKTRKVGHFSSGTYDLRRGMQARLRERATGLREPRVFSRRQCIEAPALPEFVFCVDISGSMRGPNMAAAREAFVVFQEALGDLNIAAGSLAYNSEPVLLNEIGHPPVAARRRAFDRLIDGGENDEPQALKLAASLFEQSTTSEKIVLFLTDGGAACNTRACVEEIEANSGIKVIGIGIGAGCGEVSHIYPNHVVVPAVTDLPDCLGELLSQLC